MREGSVLARRILRSEGRNSSTVSRLRDELPRCAAPGGRISGPTATPGSEEGREAEARAAGRDGAGLSPPCELGQREYTRTSSSAARMATFHGSSPTREIFQFIGADLPGAGSAPFWPEDPA